jgi:hypothetical protein
LWLRILRRTDGAYDFIETGCQGRESALLGGACGGELRCALFDRAGRGRLSADARESAGEERFRLHRATAALGAKGGDGVHERAGRDPCSARAAGLSSS